MPRPPQLPTPARSRVPPPLWRGTVNVPTFSGQQSAFILMGCLGASAVLSPLLLHQPAWLELEAVVVDWWVIWTVALAWMLHGGRRMVDDHGWKPPRTLGLPDISLDGVVPDEGCLHVLAALLVLFVVWQVLQWVVPVVGMGGYIVVRRMVTTVIANGHHCKGRRWAALGWGAFWAGLYTAPLALLVYGVHRLLA